MFVAGLAAGFALGLLVALLIGASRRGADRRHDLVAPPADWGAAVGTVPLSPAATVAPGPSADGDVVASVGAELQRGHYLNAIKLLRDGTGMGLKEAKDVVDAMRRGVAGVR